MSGVSERTVEVNGLPCRVWEKGEGAPIGFLAGVGGLMKWTPLLDRLAESRRVVAPSLPGFPGGVGHDKLDTHLDWALAAHDLLVGAGLSGADLVGVSVGGALAADVAAIWPDAVKRLVLVAPLGIFDKAEPITDIWAQRPNSAPALLCAKPEAYEAVSGLPDGGDELEWQVLQVRASEAAARLLWPVCDTGLATRLHRIVQPTLLIWGEQDQVVPPSYAKRFADGIAGQTKIVTLPGAGHMADLDEPDAVSAVILEFCG